VVNKAKSWDWGVTTQMERDWLALPHAEPAGSDDARDPIEVKWQGKTCREAVLPQPARDSLSVWSAWCRRHGYRATLNAAGNVMLLVSDQGARAAPLMREIDATSALIDEQVLGLPSRKKTAADAPLAPKPVFEDCITLLEFDTAADYASALDVIQREYPYDTALRESLAETSGFLLFTPLVAGWVRSPSGVEEWKPEHELINRLAQLSVVRQIGRPPLWFLTGAGWYAEFELKNKIYSFPYRNEFVAVEEHDGWATFLMERFKSKTGQPLTIDAFASIAPGNFHRDEAALAWGMVTFLSRKYPGAAGKFVADLAARSAGDQARPIIDCSDASAGTQLEALVKQTSRDCLDEAAAFFRAGCRKR
jgi:hypothetical protein